MIAASPAPKAGDMAAKAGMWRFVSSSPVASDMGMVPTPSPLPWPSPLDGPPEKMARTEPAADHLETPDGKAMRGRKVRQTKGKDETKGARASTKTGARASAKGAQASPEQPPPQQVASKVATAEAAPAAASEQACSKAPPQPLLPAGAETQPEETENGQVITDEMFNTLIGQEAAGEPAKAASPRGPGSSSGLPVLPASQPREDASGGIQIFNCLAAFMFFIL